ncbi:peptidylprolyl isomerase [Deltaproteobacteria bacterium IMCC39524]|nr:peptidylprolyl isomerase [Deltaproteobacteria bacterium IMCC39524]
MLLLTRFVGVLFVLLYCLSFSVAFAEQNKNEDKDILKVGNIVLTKMDFDLRLQKIMPMQLSFHGGLKTEKLNEIKEQAEDELITIAYKALYAIDEEIAVDPATFDKEWEKVLSSTQNFSETSSPYLWGKVRAGLYRQLLAQRAEEIVVNDKLKFSDEEVSSFYAKHGEMFFQPKTYTASHILVKVDPASNAEERQLLKSRAEDLLARARDGEDFYNLAYYESDDRSKYVGGSLGSFQGGQTVAEFDEAVKNLQPGDISDLVKTMYGFHIIKLDAVDEARQLTFEEAAPKIRTQLAETKRKQLYEAWMSKLKDQYPIERFDQ